MFQSLPNVQPQPSDPFFPISKLALFSEFSRAGVLAATGDDPPTGNPNLRPKDWWDDSAKGLDGTVTYLYIDNSINGSPKVGQFTIPAAEAAKPNIAGVHSFPARVIAPTNATVQGFGTSNPVPAVTLSLYSEALMLATAWGLGKDAVVEEQLSAFSYVYPPEEMRRKYDVLWNGVSLNVGQFLDEMNKNGVGAPGHWDLTSVSGGPNWISDVPPVQTFTLAPWPMPIRPLMANEALKTSQSLFAGAAPIVYRTDMTSPYNPAPASAVGSGLTPTQASDLHLIKASVDAMVKTFNVIVPS